MDFYALQTDNRIIANYTNRDEAIINLIGRNDAYYKKMQLKGCIEVDNGISCNNVSGELFIQDEHGNNIAEVVVDHRIEYPTEFDFQACPTICLVDVTIKGVDYKSLNLSDYLSEDIEREVDNLIESLNN